MNVSGRDAPRNPALLRPALADFTRQPSPSDLGEMLWSLPTKGTAEELSDVALNQCAHWFAAPLGAFWVSEPEGLRVLATKGVPARRIQQWHHALNLETHAGGSISLHGAQVAAEYGFAKRRLGALVILPTTEHKALRAWWMLARLAPQPFTEFEIQLLQLLGDRVAHTVGRTFLIQSLEKRLKHFETIVALHGFLSQPLTHAALCEQLLPRLTQDLHLTCAALENSNQEGSASATLALHHPQANLNQALLTAWNDLRANNVKAPPPFHAHLGAGDLLEIPLSSPGAPLGNLFLFRAKRVDLPQADWQVLAEHLALPIALALENALFRDSDRRR